MERDSVQWNLSERQLSDSAAVSKSPAVQRARINRIRQNWTLIQNPIPEHGFVFADSPPPKNCLTQKRQKGVIHHASINRIRQNWTTYTESNTRAWVRFRDSPPP